MKNIRVIFVCLGNICRSPAAEGVFADMARSRGISDGFIIDSAGTYGGHKGSLPDRRMLKTASKRGYNLTSRSRQFTRADFDNFDMIIVMDDSNYYDVTSLALSIEHKNKVYRFAEFCTSEDITYVPDPYTSGMEGFEHVLDILEDGCSNLLDKLTKCGSK